MVEIEGNASARLSYESVKLTNRFLNTEVARDARMAQQDQDERQAGAISDVNQGQQSSGQPPDRRDGGGGGGDGGDGFDQGNGGGEGFREVLAHPHLFSLSTPDFNELLDQI